MTAIEFKLHHVGTIAIIPRRFKVWLGRMFLFLLSLLGLFSVVHFLQFLSFAFVYFDLIVIQRFIFLVSVIEIGVVDGLKNFFIRQDYCRRLVLQLPLPIFTDELAQCIGGQTPGSEESAWY
ncbi:hypothetical protein AF45_005446 [Klebsiella pneumoniae MGH 59]|nr:hypothetical protein AF45_005446 [Klebsiella pneumoniae MGH 59]